MHVKAAQTLLALLQRLKTLGLRVSTAVAELSSFAKRRAAAMAAVLCVVTMERAFCRYRLPTTKVTDATSSCAIEAFTPP